MSYKSISTFLSSEADIGPMMDSATSVARQHDAHLEVCCMGVDTTQSMGFYAGAPALLYETAIEAAREHAEKLADGVRKKLRGAEIRWSVDTAILTIGGMNAYIGNRARFADLVVMPRPYGEGRTPQDEIATEAALFEGNAPVLVLPKPGQAVPAFRKIILAWNQSDESMRATRAALPLLMQADLVNVVVIDPPAHGLERSDPGGMLTQMLARHGVQAEVSVLARSLPRISDVLRRHVTDQDADLLVMGAYSHSRLRQSILGGTTRNLLEETQVPVFMAH